MKSDLHETFRICQDWSPQLINIVRGHAHACVHAQHMIMCMQLRAINKPSYISQIRSDIHKSFSICQAWYPVLINKVFGSAYGCMHAQHMKMCLQLRAENKPSSQPNEVRSLQNFQRMSRLVSCDDY